MKYEETLQKIGGWGRYQKLLSVLLVISTIPNGFFTMAPVFMLDLPAHHCNIDTYYIVANHTADSFSSEEINALINLTIPLEKDESGEWVRSKCSRYSTPGNFSNIIPCDKGWTFYPKYEEYTAFMEWNVVCDNLWMKPLILAMFMTGVLVGSLICGAMSDRFGRRPVFLWGMVAQFSSMFIMGFSTNPQMLAAFMFISGFCSLINYVAAFVLVTEIVEASKRALVGNMLFLGFCFGYMILPAFSYFLTNWRWLVWFMGASGVVFIPYYWLVPESPRWMMMNGKPEVKPLLRKIAKFNQAPMTEDQLLGIKNEVFVEERESNVQYTYLHLFRPAGICKRTLVMFFMWFSASVTYYCISLGTSGLGGNKFLNCFVAAAVEIPALLSALYLVEKFGRKIVLIGYLVVGGISCALASAFLKKNALLITFAMISKLCVTAVFSLIYIYCCELFPTKMRSMSVGASSTMARVGAIVAPYLVYAGDKAHPIIPYVTMGGFSILSGLLVLLLPETLNIPLPETIEDALMLKRKRTGIFKAAKNKELDGTALQTLYAEEEKE